MLAGVRLPLAALLLAAVSGAVAPEALPAARSVVAGSQHRRGNVPHDDSGNAEFRSDGEALFCRSQEEDGSGKSCQTGWRFAVNLACGPVCRSYSNERQTAHESHPAAYAAEECSRRVDSACMSTCIAGQLLGDQDFDAHSRDASDFMSSFIFAASQAKGPDAGWFAGLTSPLELASRNASLGNASLDEAAPRLQNFWETLCASGGETSYGRSLCIDEFKNPGSALDNVHFDYLDKLNAENAAQGTGTSLLETEARQQRWDLPTVSEFLNGLKESQFEAAHPVTPRLSLRLEVPSGRAATAAADEAMGLHLRGHAAASSLQVRQQLAPIARPWGTTALRDASEVALGGGVRSVRRWLEAAFLREGKRVAQCSLHGARGRGSQ